MVIPLTKSCDSSCRLIQGKTKEKHLPKKPGNNLLKATA